MGMVSFIIKADSFVERQIDIRFRITSSLPYIYTETGERIKRDALPYIPLRTNALELSGHIIQISGGAELQYSSLSPKGFDYAEIQHQREYNHPLRGTDHYLSKTIDKGAADYIEYMGSEIRRAADM